METNWVLLRKLSSWSKLIFFSRIFFHETFQSEFYFGFLFVCLLKKQHQNKTAKIPLKWKPFLLSLDPPLLFPAKNTLDKKSQQFGCSGFRKEETSGKTATWTASFLFIGNPKIPFLSAVIVFGRLHWQPSSPFLRSSVDKGNTCPCRSLRKLASPTSTIFHLWWI